MNYERIIRDRIQNDGMNISTKLLADLAIAEIKNETVYLFQYDKIVITVDKDTQYPEVHVYSMADDMSVRKYGHQFMRDLWKQTPYNRLFGRTKNKKMKRLAEIFGWDKLCMDDNGYTVYTTERI
jgi:hypothetical protein